MLMRRIVLIACACALAGNAYGAADDTARERANEHNAEAGRTASAPAADCDRLQGPERTACLAKGQSPMGSGGSSGTAAEKNVKRHKQTHHASAKSKAKKKTRASRSSSKPAGENATSETATGATESGTSH